MNNYIFSYYIFLLLYYEIFFFHILNLYFIYLNVYIKCSIIFGNLPYKYRIVCSSYRDQIFIIIIPFNLCYKTGMTGSFKLLRIFFYARIPENYIFFYYLQILILELSSPEAKRQKLSGGVSLPLTVALVLSQQLISEPSGTSYLFKIIIIYGPYSLSRP